MFLKSLLPVCIGGAIGASLRYSVIHVVHLWTKSNFPLGTIVVNCIGCFLIGILWMFLESHESPQWVKLLIITGGLGAFTTFSTYAIDILFLIESQQFLPAFFYFTLSNGLGFLCLYLGRVFL
jgi:fluoride exporter